MQGSINSLGGTFIKFCLALNEISIQILVLEIFLYKAQYFNNTIAAELKVFVLVSKVNNIINLLPIVQTEGLDYTVETFC